jgi:hypothetical protein
MSAFLRPWYLFAAALLTALRWDPAIGAEYCVASTAELRGAISAAAASAEDDVIKLVRGDFPLNSALQGDFNGSLVLRGGYAAACPILGRSLDARQTRIFGSPVQGALVNLRLGDGDLEIDGLSFEDLAGVQVVDSGGAVAANGTVSVRRSRFEGNEFGLNLVLRNKNTRVENNLFLDNRSLCCGSETLNVGLAVRHANVNSPGITVDVLFNTVLGNPKGVVIQGGGPFSRTPLIQNNILRPTTQGTGTFALKLDVARVTATNNIWGTIDLEDGGGFVSNLLNLDTDPVLDADYVPDTGSPARNSGTDFVIGGVPSTDHDGGPRVIGSLPDRGALESPFSDIGIITVTSLDNSGAGTLRQAILDSNQTTNAELIRFNLGAAGNCPYTITPTSLLPAITSPLTIDGWSQPGSSPNTESTSDDAVRCVIVRGSVAQGLRLQPPADRQIKVSGLAFYGFTGAAIEVSGDGLAIIEGNGFGTGANVLATDFAGDAIRVDGADGTRIGGEDDAQRNLVGRATGAGIRLLAGSNREVINNFIGLTPNGYGSAANGVGIHLSDAVGDLLEDNDIAHSDAQGILIDGAASSSLTIDGNRIGRSPSRNPDPGIAFAAGNGSNGIRITTGTGHEIASNRVAHNGTDGIVVLTDAIARINANRIYENAQQGIDLSPNGVDTQNSDQDPSNRGNAGQNYPVLGTAIGTNGEGVVTGSLPSSTGEFTIQLFASQSCDDDGFGEGEALIGTASVEIGGIPVPGGGGGTLPIDSSVGFSAPVSSLFANFGLVGRYITATATRRSNDATSEFSACILYEAGPQIFDDGFESE